MQLAQQPVYVMRGHAAPIHALHFYRSNSRLVSADADGWAVVWNLTTRRPVAVWRAHNGAVLGVSDWDDCSIVTHGRDNKIYVWQLRPGDEAGLDTELPAASQSDRRHPWLLHSLEVNALNFCAFTMCYETHGGSDNTGPRAVMIAVPSSRDPNTIDVYHLPSGNRRHVAIGSGLGFKTGMPMALKLLYMDSCLSLIAGFESGHAVVFRLDTSAQAWSTIYCSKPHTQPVLSLDCTLDGSSFYTSSADSIIAKHQMPPDDTSTASSGSASPPSQVINTHHAGQQGLVLRSDGKVFATAGWDSRIRVYSGKSMKEVAVLKWHKEGCYTVAFARIFDSADTSCDSLAAAGNEVVQANQGTLTVAQQREDRNKKSHILAAGSKDGRVSLWEVF
ncbi:ASTRA complex subunit [Orbilia brochopaga]|uniref:ASTRA-associated protein 1 n=1 Tax=Orbilia brochopaga TaxID=3140254 RepID=A0AAV9U464_9PEZI